KALELRDLASAADGPVSFAPLSLDPAATAGEVAKILLYSLTLIAAARVLSNRGGTVALLRAIAASGVLIAVLGYVQMALDVHQPYGHFGPMRPLYTATFVNLNHLAGFLGLTSLVALALVLRERGWQRWAWGAAAAVCGSGVFLSLSRGGILAFVLALVVLAVLAAARHLGRRLETATVLAVLLGTAGVATLFAYSRVVHELWTLSDEGTLLKAEIWRPLPSMLRDFPFLGIGRGAFATLYPHYKALPHTLTFTHLENEWLQLLVDFGPAVGIALLALLALSFARAVRQARERRWRLALVAALVFVALHNLMDFSLTLPAVALPALLLLLVGEWRAEAAPVAEQATSRLRWPRAAVVATLATLLVAGSYLATRYAIGADSERLAHVLRETRHAKDLAAAGTPVMRRHPADYVLPLFVAEAMLERGGHPRAVLRLVNHGLYLAPWYYAGHELAGRALLALGAKRQAALEYRLACVAEDLACAGILDDLWRRSHDPALLVDLAERGDATLRLRIAALLVREKAWDDALTVLRFEPASAEPYALILEVQATLARGNAKDALAVAEQLTALRPQEDAGYGMQADALTRLGESERALAVLELGITRVREPSAL
ncbi:MAG: O-antigen ligase family protein, partial [Myxococcota bacterium]